MPDRKNMWEKQRKAASFCTFSRLNMFSYTPKENVQTKETPVLRLVGKTQDKGKGGNGSR